MPVSIYRILHINNLKYILDTGRVVAPNHPLADPDYVGIGNNAIIDLRRETNLPFDPSRTFKDYVAFYFGPRSIMLFNIITGYNVIQQSQEDIIYLRSEAESIVKSGKEYFFTDGNGSQIPTTRVFLNWGDIEQVDMEAAYATRWSAADLEVDPDLKRRKHAEFHVFQELDINLIKDIIVLNEAVYNIVNPIIQKKASHIQVLINPNNGFYFPNS